MSESRPDGFTVERLRRLEARLVPYAWAWARDNAGRIAENWARRRAGKPALFDGPVLLACACVVAEDVCRVDFFETRYAAFLAHRDCGSPDGQVANGFAAIVPWSADGHVILGRMGAHTANAGQIYFPCGTPDRDDVRGAVVDLAGSAARELGEETGLAVPADAGETWVLLRGDGQLAFLRPVRFDASAAALVERIEAHRTGESDPELAGTVTVPGAEAIDARAMPPFVRAYLANAFDAAARNEPVTPS